MSLYLGVDVGLTGAVALLDEHGTPLRVVTMPVKGGLVDARRLHDLFSKLSCKLAVVEALRTFGIERRKSLWTFGTCNGMTLAALDIAGLPYLAVEPKVWKNALLAGTKKDKKAAISYCHHRYPGVDLAVGPHGEEDGAADAILLAEYGRRQLLTPVSRSEVTGGTSR